jgi:uncharacterized protein YraI
MRVLKLILFIGLVWSLVACGNQQASSVSPVVTPTTIVTQAVQQAVTDPEQATTEAPPPLPTFTSTPTLVPTASNTPVASTTPEATSTAVPSPTDEPEEIAVDEDSGTNVNVRSGPGTNYPVVAQLEPGAIAQVTGRNSDTSWWKIKLPASIKTSTDGGWVYGAIVVFSGETEDVTLAAAPPPPPTVTPAPENVPPATTEDNSDGDENAPEDNSNDDDDAPAASPEELASQLRCGKDFCVTYQAMVPIWENAGCIGNHSIYVTVLEGLPPGRPMDGVVIGDTFGNIEVASGSKGPGTAEVTLWMNTMSLYVKRHIDGTEYTSEESFAFTAHDELIPAEVLAAAGYCDGSVETCRQAQQLNQICRGHYSWRVTFHKFDQ